MTCNLYALLEKPLEILNLDDGIVRGLLTVHCELQQLLLALTCPQMLEMPAEGLHWVPTNSEK